MLLLLQDGGVSNLSFFFLFITCCSKLRDPGSHTWWWLFTRWDCFKTLKRTTNLSLRELIRSYLAVALSDIYRADCCGAQLYPFKIITDFSCYIEPISVTLAVLCINLIRTVIQSCAGDKGLWPLRVGRLKIETGCAHSPGKLINIAACGGHLLPAICTTASLFRTAKWLVVITEKCLRIPAALPSVASSLLELPLLSWMLMSYSPPFQFAEYRVKYSEEQKEISLAARNTQASALNCVF